MLGQRIRRPECMDFRHDPMTGHRARYPYSRRDEADRIPDGRHAPERRCAQRHGLAHLERGVHRAVHDQHGEADRPGQQGKRAQQAEETSREDRPLQLIEMKRQAEEQVSERHPEQQRRNGAADEQGPVPGVAPAWIGDLVAEHESHGPQDEGQQQHEHREVQARERGRIKQWPGRKHHAACQDEPHLVAVPDRLDGFEQRASLLIRATEEAKRRPDAEVESVHDREADQECAQDQPPDQAQGCIVGHGPLLFTARQPLHARTASSRVRPVRGGSCAPAGTRPRPRAQSKRPRMRRATARRW